MVISCADGRVDPAILFGTRPGELFMVRNVANLIPAYAPDAGLHGVSAAIEFRVRDLMVEHLVVLGHAFCGGIPGPYVPIIAIWLKRGKCQKPLTGNLSIAGSIMPARQWQQSI